MGRWTGRKQGLRRHAERRARDRLKLEVLLGHSPLDCSKSSLGQLRKPFVKVARNNLWRGKGQLATVVVPLLPLHEHEQDGKVPLLV